MYEYNRINVAQKVLPTFPAPLFMSSKSILPTRPSATKRGINLEKEEKFLHRKLQMRKTKSYVSNHMREQMQEVNAAITSYRCSVHEN
jgi:hypothetical protein